jgi:hypothetical protein
MNNSTAGVRIYASFVNLVLMQYQPKKYLYTDLFEIVEGYDLDAPDAMVPIDLYNDTCAWIERELGKYSLIRIGRFVGQKVWDNLIGRKMISTKSSPIEILENLKIAAESLIDDPENRSWEFLEIGNCRVVMRRTQTFNRLLQLGMLDGLVSKCDKVVSVNVSFLKSIEEGAEFDDYLITWIER